MPGPVTAYLTNLVAEGTLGSMTEPTSFESAIERTIREAIERGEFDDLPGQGKPLPGAGEADTPDWWIRGWMDRRRQIDDLAEIRLDLERRVGRLWDLPSAQRVTAAVADINRSLPAGVEPLDPDEIVVTWRQMYRARRGTIERP